MDIEKAIRDHPLLGIPFLLCSVLAGCLLLAFLAQWNDFSVAERQWHGFRGAWRQEPGLRTLLRWSLLGGFISAKLIWNESRGVRFGVPQAGAMGAAAGFPYWLLERISQP